MTGSRSLPPWCEREEEGRLQRRRSTLSVERREDLRVDGRSPVLPERKSWRHREREKMLRGCCSGRRRGRRCHHDEGLKREGEQSWQPGLHSSAHAQRYAHAAERTRSCAAEPQNAIATERHRGNTNCTVVHEQRRASGEVPPGRGEEKQIIQLPTDGASCPTPAGRQQQSRRSRQLLAASVPSACSQTAHMRGRRTCGSANAAQECAE